MEKELGIKTIIAIAKLESDIIPYPAWSGSASGDPRWSDFSEVKRLNEDYLVLKKKDTSNEYPYNIYSIKKNKIVNGWRCHASIGEILNDIARGGWNEDKA